ncbi:MAG: hypothetical protein R2795_11730 [Saprospiraceae bacterium]
MHQKVAHEGFLPELQLLLQTLFANVFASKFSYRPRPIAQTSQTELHHHTEANQKSDPVDFSAAASRNQILLQS